MRSFFGALTFLTILPLPKKIVGNEETLAKGLIHFPAVGLLIGLGTMVLDHALFYVMPIQLVSFLMVIFLLGVSGALHLDGFADTLDGFLSARPRERVLSIMKDSHVGAMGVAGIVCLILLKWISLTSVPVSARWATLLLMPLTGRTALLLMMCLLTYVRREGGLATVFSEHGKIKWAGSAIGVTLILAIGFLGFRGKGVIIGASCIAGICLFCLWAYRKIGGYTGDTLGAVCEMSELFVPVLVIVFSGGNNGI
ncbi:MAG: adenosylcobinamide-GDP ribazoletransferase [Deltaproteobacteria bacterium]|nr:MAG: adenosylcobinamide-GDP ribazoletransferase [Deltaproteobacteria bacterium]